MDREQSKDLFEKYFINDPDEGKKWSGRLRQKKRIIIDRLGGHWPVIEDWDEAAVRSRLISNEPEVQSWLDSSRLDLSGLKIGSNEEIPLATDNIAISGDQLKLANVTFPGEVSFEKTEFLVNVDFSDSAFEENTSFLNCKFHKKTDFSEAKFKGRTDFNRSSFRDTTLFEKAIFKEKAHFFEVQFYNPTFWGNAKFNNTVTFENSRFSAQAVFYKTEYIDRTYFKNIVFVESVIFKESVFNNIVDFSGSVFQHGADFTGVSFIQESLFRRSHFYKELNMRGVNTDKICDFSDSSFSRFIPDFSLMDAITDLRLDRVKILETIRSKQDFEIDDPRPWPFRHIAIAPEIDATIKYRSLKKIANENHDHLVELNMFIDEMRARRFWYDKPFSLKDGAGRFWWGLIYGWISDYGRSMFRPLLGWAVCLFIFAAIAFSQARVEAINVCRTTGDNPIQAAFSISSFYSLPFISLKNTDTIKKDYVCLYGSKKLNKTTNNRDVRNVMIPNLSRWFSFWSLINSVLSGAFIFLFLLAIRNQFKIK